LMADRPTPNRLLRFATSRLDIQNQQKNRRNQNKQQAGHKPEIIHFHGTQPMR
jgi:hypothetical protein